MESLWSKTATIEQRGELTKDIDTEVAVIGAGLAGILTAYLLQQRGLDVVVLEASSIASGQTKNTTAKITSQHGLVYHKYIQDFGEEKAKQYANANELAISTYKKIIEQNKIECDFEMVPAFLYSTVEKEPLINEANAAKKLGINAEFTEESMLPFSVKGVVKFNNQAQFHPLLFIKEIARGLTIYEQTKVIDVEDNLVKTKKGNVKGNHIVFATHYPFINAPGYYFLRMHQDRSYVISLENAAVLDGMYRGIDEDGLSFRNYKNQLILGGGSHRSGENRSGGQYENLRKKAKLYWPESTESAYWSAQDCMTLDHVPYIGKYSASTPNWYVATGFKKWGMTSSMVSAQILTDLITHNKNQNAEIFSPQRFTPTASAKTFLDEGKHAVKNLSKRIIAPPRAQLDELPLGHGGIVEVEGDKVGVYKDEDGKVYTVSVCCSHLGCQLEWNPEEKTWDCPCHGSRFDYHGKIINNPTQNDIIHD